MINKGSLVEGEIIDFTHEGNGVLKIDGFTVFTKGGIIGDKVQAKIEEKKKNYAVGSLVEILEPSVDRIEDPMEITESRGGIPLVNYKYEKQLEWKTNKVKMDLERIGDLEDVQVNDAIKMEEPFRYRNHTQIPIGEQNGKVVMGFYEINSRDIVDMEGSILQTEQANRIMNIVKVWIDEFHIQAYNKKTKKGYLRHLGIRTNKDGESMVILVTGSNRLPMKEEIIERLKEENVVSIYQNINKMDSAITYGNRYKNIYGNETLLDYIDKYKFNISPNSFFQVNRVQAEVLYDKAMDYLELDGEDEVYDLYCGIGTISLYVAEKAKKIHGVEMVKATIDDARENAKLNNIDNTEFIYGKAEIIFPKMMEQGMDGTKVVIDPPRKGCDKEVLESIIELSPERVVYISCNPSTMARDAKFLTKNRYKIVEVQPVDMFPQTAHIETVTLFVKE